MMETFAYEIAAAFFLAAVLMGGSLLRGFFSQEILRGFKLAATGLILAGTGLWIYRTFTWEPAATPVATAVPGPADQTGKAKRAAAIRASDRKALASAMADEAAKPDIPDHIGNTPVDDHAIVEKHGSKIAKSLGRVLHIVPKPKP